MIKIDLSEKPQVEAKKELLVAINVEEIIKKNKKGEIGIYEAFFGISFYDDGSAEVCDDEIYNLFTDEQKEKFAQAGHTGITSVEEIYRLGEEIYEREFGVASDKEYHFYKKYIFQLGLEEIVKTKFDMIEVHEMDYVWYEDKK